MTRNEQNIENLYEAILFTLVYFDTFDYPITVFEAWRYLFKQQATIREVMVALDELVKRGTLETHYGFYYLPKRRGIVEERQKRYHRSEKLWGKALRATKLLAYIPYIQSIMVVNSLSYFNCRDTSDIDFLITTRKGKIWTTRALSSILLHALGLRRYGRKTAGKVCLSFYVAEDKLDLSYIAQDELGYFVAFWIAQAAPLLDRKASFQRFWEANRWIAAYLPNAASNVTDYHSNFKHPTGSTIASKTLELILSPQSIEQIARALQQKKMVRSQKKRGNPPSVLYDNHILKFHPIDWRIEYKKEIDKKMTNYC